MIKKLKLEYRIILLEGRQKDNANIIKKLKRQLRKLDK